MDGPPWNYSRMITLTQREFVNCPPESLKKGVTAAACAALGYASQGEAPIAVGVSSILPTQLPFGEWLFAVFPFSGVGTARALPRIHFCMLDNPRSPPHTGDRKVLPLFLRGVLPCHAAFSYRPRWYLPSPPPPSACLRRRSPRWRNSTTRASSPSSTAKRS